MPNDDQYGTMRDNSRDDGSDPLGLIGWALQNKYKVTDYIGEGGFGEVYKGYNIALKEQKVVIKILKRNHEAEWTQKEARILGMLDHPNICRLVDFLPEDRALVVQYIDGKNFDEILKLGTPLTDKLFLKAAATLMDTLAFAHKRKVAHRDIKPSNIMLDRYGHIYIIDFGIAKKIGGTVTRTGLGAGWSFWTAAPERRHGRKGYNPFLSDIFEVGITLYYLATRLWPYSDPENPDPDRWGKSTDIPLSNRLRKVLRKATHPSPDMRFQSIEEMAHEMAGVRTIRKRSKTRYLVAALAVAAIGAAYVGVYQSNTAVHTWNTFIANLSQSPQTQPEQGALENASTQLEDQDVVLAQEQAPHEIIAGIDSVQEETVPQQPAVEREKSKPAEKVETVVAATQQEEEPVEPQQADAKDTTTVQDYKTDKPPQSSLQKAGSLADKNADLQPSEKEVPPSPPKLSIDVSPSDEVNLLVDGLQRELGAASLLAAGHHDITIIHPDFPFFEERVNLKQDSSLSFDLNEHFSQTESFGIQIGAVPPLTDALLRVFSNGKSEDYGKIPVRGLKSLLGKWQLRFELLPADSMTSQSLRVDSFTVKPGIAADVDTIRSNEAILNFGAVSWGKRKRSKIVIYWTGQ